VRPRNVKVCQGTAATKKAKMKSKEEKNEKPSERSCGQEERVLIDKNKTRKFKT